MPESTLTSIPGDIAAAIEAGRQLGELHTISLNGSTLALVPAGYQLQELKHLRERPQRIDTTVKVTSATAFIDYWQRFQTPASMAFVDTDKAKIVGILDYHAADGIPAFREHRITYEIPKTPEWDKWAAANGKAMEQEEFAKFIEDMAPEIVEPTSAQMLEIASTLAIQKNASFSRAIRLDNGQVQFTYTEDLQGRAGAQGHLNIPEKIRLGVQLFRGEARDEIVARFRYRLHGGNVKMWVDMVRPHETRDRAVREIAARIAAVVGPERLIESEL